VAAPAVKVVDTTGAGDAFHAALVARLAADPAPTADRLRAHLEHACARGSAACTRLGAT
jgi:sugar/nucleoside kinase (ribokinase family)